VKEKSSFHEENRGNWNI